MNPEPTTRELLERLAAPAGSVAALLARLAARPNVLPEALRLLNGGDDRTRAMMLVALRLAVRPEAWAQAPAAWTEIEGLTRDPSPKIRALAVRLLANRGSPAWETISARLSDPDATIQRAAVASLARIDRRAASVVLAERLSAVSGRERADLIAAAYAEGVSELGAASETYVDDASVSVRRAVVDLLALAISEGHDATTPMVRALNDPDADVRLRAASGLALCAEDLPLAPLHKALGDPSPAVRGCAVIALERRGKKDACRALQASLADSDASVRRAATQALGTLKCVDARAALLSCLESTETTLERATILGALCELGGADPSPGLENLDHPSPHVRVEAIRLVARTATSSSARTLAAKLAGDPAAEVRARSAIELGHVAPDIARGALIRALVQDVDAAVRRSAARALKGSRAPDVLEAELDALGDADATVRAAVASNLGESDEPSVEAALIEAQAHEPDLAARAEICRALWRLRGEEAERVTSPRAVDLFDPGRTGAAFTIWLLDVFDYRTPERVVFYATSIVEAIDLDGASTVWNWCADEEGLKLEDEASAISFDVVPGSARTGTGIKAEGHFLTLTRDPFFASLERLRLFAPRPGRS